MTEIDGVKVICFTEYQANEIDIVWAERDSLKVRYDFCKSVVIEQRAIIDQDDDIINMLELQMIEDRKKVRVQRVKSLVWGIGGGLIVGIITGIAI